MKIQQTTSEAEGLLTVDDLAKLFRCSARHVHRMQDKLPKAIRLGRLLRWRATEITKFLQEQQDH